MASPVLKMAWSLSSGAAPLPVCSRVALLQCLQLAYFDCRRKGDTGPSGLFQTPALSRSLAMETSCPSPVKDRNTVVNLEMSSGLAKGEGPLVLGPSSQTLSLL